MNKQAIPSGAVLLLILGGKTYYHTASPDLPKTHNVRDVPPEQFDAWASSLVEEITGVNRAAWDVFARWKFIVALQEQGVLEVSEDGAGLVLITETELPAEEKTSA